jgi:hypothetical protein
VTRTTRVRGPRMDRKPLVLFLAFAGLAAALSLDASAADAEDAGVARFYAGTGITRVSFDDAYNRVNVDDVSTGFVAYLGFRLREQLSLEVSYDASDAIDRSDVAGSGVVRFDIVGERRTVAISALREVSLQDLFDWRRDWRVFGIAGIYASSLDRTVTTLGSNVRTANSERIHGALLGAGFLRRIAGVEVRGYVRQFGILEGAEALETGATVQFRF